MSDWQPIETAPKDGTVILITDGKDTFAGMWGVGKTHADAFKCDDEFPWSFIDQDGDLNAWMTGKHGPTHWMPLPPPPKGGE